MQEYWQKKPLLVRKALPGFNGLLTQQELIELASQETVESRLVTHKNKQWKLKYGPFKARDFKRLSNCTWSLLVQDVNHHLLTASDLLLKFSFIPHARLDDLMVSYAPAGGGVGPHYDSYDVFLLQGAGQRRWDIAADFDDTLMADAPLKILQRFNAEQSWILEPGDMLYLPPNYGHHGIAVDDCMTYSIGFRAPSYQELITQFLIYLQDHLIVNGWYTDPDLELQNNPLEISADMRRKMHAILKKISWKSTDMDAFLGMYLTEPKPHVFFDPPEQPLSFKQFNKAIQEQSIQLDLKSRMLCGHNHVFINGEIYNADSTSQKILSPLIYRQKKFIPNNLNAKTEKILYQWYVNGYISFAGNNR